MMEVIDLEKLNLKYLTPGTAASYDFYSFPKLIIHHAAFDGIDYGAKILYSLILSRASLSAINAKDYTDNQGRLYIIYTIDQVMKDLRCSNKTAVKMIKQLEDIGLIEKKKQGQGKPTLIFVKDFGTLDFGKFQECNFYTSGEGNTKKCKNYTSESVHSKECKNYTSANEDNTHPEVEEIHPNYNNNSYTDNSNPNLILSSSQPESGDDISMDYDKIRKDVYLQINFEYLKDHVSDSSMLKEISEIMVEILASTQAYYNISGNHVPTVEVQKRIKQIGHEHLRVMIDMILEQRTYIKNIKAYIIKCLFNLPVTTETYFGNRVATDMF